MIWIDKIKKVLQLSLKKNLKGISFFAIDMVFIFYRNLLSFYQKASYILQYIFRPLFPLFF